MALVRAPPRRGLTGLPQNGIWSVYRSQNRRSIGTGLMVGSPRGSGIAGRPGVRGAGSGGARGAGSTGAGRTGRPGSRRGGRRRVGPGLRRLRGGLRRFGAGFGAGFPSSGKKSRAIAEPMFRGMPSNGLGVHGGAQSRPFHTCPCGHLRCRCGFSHSSSVAQLRERPSSGSYTRGIG